MHHSNFLSIIIPCYNSAETVEEAVASCFLQGLKDFEIIMVDDNSSDATRTILDALSKKHPEIRILLHEENKGGGATRNTGIRNARGEIIFCLDSDDILPEHTLDTMCSYLQEKKCDGVGLHRSTKFRGKDTSDIHHIDTFTYAGDRIPFESLMQKDGVLCPLYSVFLFTRESFEITGGYPEDHGFDTQGFAWRFLAHGLTAYTCPHTNYLHRVDFHTSYYLREYQEGKVNINWQLILEDFLYLFADSVKELIVHGIEMKFDRNLFDGIRSIPSPFVKGLSTLVTHDTQVKHKDELESLPREDLSNFDLYWLGSFYLNRGSFEKSYEIMARLRETCTWRMVEIKISMCQAGMNGRNPNEILVLRNRMVDPLPRTSFKGLIIRIAKKFRPLYALLLHIKIAMDNMINLSLEGPAFTQYKKDIEMIIRSKEIILDIEFGGLGDWLVFTSLPRLLYEKYRIEFYLSPASLERVRNKHIITVCFEMNPHFKGIKEGKYFSYRPFLRQKSMWTLLSDFGTSPITETVERQFKIFDKGLPEIYYEPKIIPEYAKKILVDKNYISGKKLGWLYSDSSFEREIDKNRGPLDSIQYVDPGKQDLFTYIDMIFSSKHFITVLSGGAALAASREKLFTVILPYNVWGGSVDQFVFKNSKGTYVK